MSRKNKIDEAFEELESQEAGLVADEDDLSEEDLDEEDFQDEELTDEDVEAEVKRLDAEAQAAIQRTRKAGRSKRGRREGRQGRAQQQSRVREEQRETPWTETSSLDAPPPRPGMEQRWIRVSVGDKNDPRNVSRKRREQWVPRALDTVPEGFAPPTISHGSLGSVISVLDLVLCERPLSVGASRRKHFTAKAARQKDAAMHRHTDALTRHGGPGVQRRVKQSLTRGVGRRVQAQED